ncbi:helix-turn-helix domain-containing protein [Clostridium sardiniense]|uniref:helix-turn-helix domain-containing protein n=1 Tax=Clostridium sardiniense TaxID=29369 RepID=UPI003D32E06C
MATIADRIKEALEIRNMKQADLVEKTKIGKSSISTYISGAYEPKQKNIYKIAKALDVNEAWLMGLAVPMEKTSELITKTNITLSEEEQQHIEDLRKLNDIGKKKVITYTKDLMDNPKFINNSAYKSSENETCASLAEENDTPYLIACHDDNLSNEEKNIMNEKINEFLNKKN